MENIFIERFINNYSLTKQKEPNFEALVTELENTIRYLVQNDFTKLVNLLYRADVDEKKLKQRLHNTEEDSAVVIARLVIERELEKYKSRMAYRHENQPGEEERW